MIPGVVAASGNAGGGTPSIFEIASITSNAENATTPGSITVTKPSGVESSDLLLVMLGTADTAGGNNWTTLAGWTLEGHDGSTVSDSTITVMSRIADGGEGASFTFVNSDTADDLTAVCLRIPKAETISPVGVYGVESIANTTTPSAPSITTLYDDCIVIAMMAKDGVEGTAWAVDGTWNLQTVLPSDPGGAGHEFVWADDTEATAGATAAAGFSYTGSSDGTVALQISIRPATSRPGAHRYWRVLCEESANASYYGICELEFHETVGGADTTTSGQEIHSVERSATFAGTKAFDNIVSNSDNNSWGASNTGSEYIGQDYGVAGDIEILEITMTSRDDSFYDQCPRQFKLQWSDDAAAWTTSIVANDEPDWSQDETRTYI